MLQINSPGWFFETSSEYPRYGLSPSASITSIWHGLCCSCLCSAPLRKAKYIMVLRSACGLWYPRTFTCHSFSSLARLVWVLNPVLLISASSSQHPVFAKSLQIQHLEKCRWKISYFHEGSAWDQSQCSAVSLVDTLCHLFPCFQEKASHPKLKFFSSYLKQGRYFVN